MTDIGLPGVARVDTEQLRRDLSTTVDGDVRFEDGTRGAYSTDASNDRHVPLGVIEPHAVESGTRAVRVCHEHGVPAGKIADNVRILEILADDGLRCWVAPVTEAELETAIAAGGREARSTGGCATSSSPWPKP